MESILSRHFLTNLYFLKTINGNSNPFFNILIFIPFIHKTLSRKPMHNRQNSFIAGVAGQIFKPIHFSHKKRRLFQRRERVILIYSYTFYSIYSILFKNWLLAQKSDCLYAAEIYFADRQYALPKIQLPLLYAPHQ